MVVLYLEQPSSSFDREKDVLSDMTKRERDGGEEGWKQRAGVAAGKDSCAGWLRPPLEECLCHSVTTLEATGETQISLTSPQLRPPFFLLLLLADVSKRW